MNTHLSRKYQDKAVGGMENSGMRYLNVVFRYWFILAIFAGLTGSVSYFFQLRQPVSYQSSVKVFVGNALDTPDPEVSSFESAERLALTYAELVRSYAILNRAIARVNPDTDVETLKALVSVDVISDTSILIINVRDQDAQQAADLANAIAETLIVTTPSTLSPEQEQQISRIREQISSLEELIRITNVQHQETVDALQQNPGELATVIGLTGQLNSSYASLALLENEYQKLSNRISRIEVIDAARPNFEALGLNPKIIAVAGAFLGVVVAISGVIILDVFDTTLRSEEDIKSCIDAPIIGVIKRERWSHKKLQNAILSGELLKTTINSQYREAVSNIVFSATHETHRHDTKLYTVISPQRGNGRTFTAINLAMAAVDSGLKVLLVDFDGVNPEIHTYFWIESNQYGVSYLMNHMLSNPNVLDDDETFASLYECVVHSSKTYDGLYILPGNSASTQQSRTIPRLQAVDAFLQQCVERYGYDMVIMDTPASYTSLDAVNLVAVTKSRVLLVIERKGTTQAVAHKVTADFHRLGHDIDGIIIN